MEICSIINKKGERTMKLKEIFSKYDLKVKKIDDKVFQVKSDNLVDTDIFKREFNKCILIVSDVKRKLKDEETCTYHDLKNIYYIIFDLNDDNIWIKYSNLSKSNFGEGFVEDYEKSRDIERLGTLYEWR